MSIPLEELHCYPWLYTVTTVKNCPGCIVVKNERRQGSSVRFYRFSCPLHRKAKRVAKLFWALDNNNARQIMGPKNSAVTGGVVVGRAGAAGSLACPLKRGATWWHGACSGFRGSSTRVCWRIISRTGGYLVPVKRGPVSTTSAKEQKTLCLLCGADGPTVNAAAYHGW